jgi:RecA-family ATPase
MSAGVAYPTGLPARDIPAIAELENLHQWVVWKREIRDGRPTKVPHRSCGNRRASTTDAATWSTYAECARAFVSGHGDGVGFVFTGTPYTGVDIDHCVDADGRPNDLAAEVVKSLASYTEISPSGDGLHIIARGDLPEGARKRDDLEMYSEGRYFTMTGHAWAGAPQTIEERTDALHALHARIFQPLQPTASLHAGSNGTGKFQPNDRHDQLKRCAVALRKQGISERAILLATLEFNQERCNPPKSEDEVRRLVEWTNAKVEPDEEEREVKPLRLLTAEEVYADKIPNAVIEGMVHEGQLTNLPATNKGGKTYFSLQAAMATGAGSSFLGKATKQCNVLYVCLEMTAAMLLQRVEQIARDTGTPMPRIGENFFIYAPTAQSPAGLSLLDARQRKSLELTIQENNIGLVVLDTLYRFVPGAEQNDNTVMGVVFGDIADLALRSGAGVLLLDHTSRATSTGEISNSPSTSGLGAVIKGGAARTIIKLSRVNRIDGGSWSVDVESHFGSWDEPITYKRPEGADGKPGVGCVLCSATDSRGLSEEKVRELFAKYAQRDETGRAQFPSRRRFEEAMQTARLVAEGSRSSAQDYVKAIERDLCADGDGLENDWKNMRPIWIYRAGTGNNAAKRYVWRGSLDPVDQVDRVDQ